MVLLPLPGAPSMAVIWSGLAEMFRCRNAGIRSLYEKETSSNSTRPSALSNTAASDFCITGDSASKTSNIRPPEVMALENELMMKDDILMGKVNWLR